MLNCVLPCSHRLSCVERALTCSPAALLSQMPRAFPGGARRQGGGGRERSRRKNIVRGAHVRAPRCGDLDPACPACSMSIPAREAVAWRSTPPARSALQKPVHRGEGGAGVPAEYAAHLQFWRERPAPHAQASGCRRCSGGQARQARCPHGVGGGVHCWARRNGCWGHLASHGRRRPGAGGVRRRLR